MNERLECLKAYLKEAKLDPENNKLYIEDLKLSIKYFEQIQNKNFEVFYGFERKGT